MSTSSSRSPILWGAYLACSWTWCIGMFLPALLLRDLGWAGFLIFAVPNVIGAAAMGWILQSKRSSIELVTKHPIAVWCFSVVTLAFHLFWILWISSFIRTAFQIPNTHLAIVGGIVLAFIILSDWARRCNRMPQLAAALLAISLSVLIATYCTSDVKEANSALINSAPKSLAPLWMFPSMIFGFLLCPYLDITFHHARQQLDTKKSGRLGFTLGFVGFFAPMILLTTRYSGVLAGALDGTNFVPIASPWLATGLLTHILCQWIFTVRAHLDRIRTLPCAQAKQPLFIGIVVLAGFLGSFASKFPAYAGLTGGELIYRTFMSAYGLAFPAYILYRIAKKKPISLATLWVAIALATPMFWMGFMERQSVWLIPGMITILLGCFSTRKNA